ncbi:hypothetical protein GCM10027447_05040 [Glycomyces halotolerans]
MRPYDVVELTEDIPHERLVKGQIGTIVDSYEDPPGFEVEFTDSEGITIALLPLRPDQLRTTATTD